MKITSLLLIVAVIASLMLSSCGGKRYKEVTIGDQVWMAENLNVDKFRNGDRIPHAQTDEEWTKAGKNKQPAWCYNDNDPANGKIYGKLYNFYAVSDWRGLAPDGWRIPSDADWSKLVKILGGEDYAGAKLKSSDTTYWKCPNTSATNETGFTALPGGYRYSYGRFINNGRIGIWWSATEDYINGGWCREVNCFFNGVLRSHTNNKRLDFSVEELGLSIRCIKD